jgi:esterase/lipase
MQKCQQELNKITLPTLTIQAKNDPVVNPISGDIIFENIGSKHKKILKPDMWQHNILTGQGKETIFKEIVNFIKEIP